MGCRFWVAALVFAASCVRSKLPLIVVNTDEATVALSVQARNDADYDARVASVHVEVQSVSDASTRRSVDVAGTERTIVLTGLPTGVPLRVNVTGRTRAQEDIYFGTTDLDALPRGANVPADLDMNGLPAVQLSSTRGQSGAITILYDLRDPEDDPCQIELEYRGGKNIAVFGPATVEGETRDVKPGLGRELRWVSSAPADEPQRNTVVQLLLSVSDRHAGIAAQSSQLNVLNDTDVPAAPDAIVPSAPFGAEMVDVCVKAGTSGTTYVTRVFAEAGDTPLFEVTSSNPCATVGPFLEGRYRFAAFARNVANVESAIGAEASFEVDLTAPGVPTVAPILSVIQPVLTVLTWTSVPGAAAYLFELGTDPTFTTGLLVSEVTESNTFSYRPDPFDKRYYFRVRAIDAAGNRSAPSSPALTMDVDATPPAAPVLVTPPAVTADTTPVLRFAASGADLGGFTLEIATDSAFAVGDIVHATSLGGAEREHTPPALSGSPARLYWFRVVAVDVAGNQSAPSAAASFTVDSEAPATPLSCALVGASCFDGVCGAVSATSLSVTFDDPQSDVVSYDAELWQVAGVMPAHAFTGLSPSGGVLTLGVGGVGLGAYELRLYAVDAAGTRSAALSCAPAAITFDRTPPPAPRLLGGYAPSGKDSVSPASVVATLSFLPPTSAPDLAPIVGYAFELTSEEGAELSRCGVAVPGAGPSTPVTTCDGGVVPVYFSCPVTPSIADPCKVTDVAVLPAAQDRIYRIALYAVDAAGNRSAPASLGTRFGVLATNELFADVAGPPVAEPLDPVSCNGFTDLDPRILPQGNRVTLSWQSDPQATRYIVNVSAYQRQVWGCSQDAFASGSQACRGDLYCDPALFGDPPDKAYECRLCQSVGEAVFSNGTLTCGAPPSTVCLRPTPQGTCAPEHEIATGWHCSQGLCSYRMVTGNVTSAVVDLVGTGLLDQALWYVLPVDGAGNYEKVTDEYTQVESRFACTNGSKSTRYRLNRSPPSEPPFYTDLSFGGRADLVSPSNQVTLSSAHPYLMFFAQDLADPLRGPSVRLQVQRMQNGVAGDIVYETTFACRNGNCECPNEDLAQCDLDPADGFADGFAHRVATTLTDGDYRWRFRLEDSYGNVAGWWGCSQLAHYASDGVVLCDDWDRNPTTQEGRFSIMGGGGGTSDVPTLVWPPPGSDCSTVTLAWPAVAATAYNVEIWSFNQPVPVFSGEVPSSPAALQQLPNIGGPQGLTPSNWYYARVNAVTGTGPSLWSTPVTFRYQGPSAVSCALP